MSATEFLVVGTLLGVVSASVEISVSPTTDGMIGIHWAIWPP